VVVSIPSWSERRPAPLALKRAKGSHVVMVADQASATGQGHTYGLFECHQPLSGPGPSHRAPQPK
jgi:hypothetical protein